MHSLNVVPFLCVPCRKNWGRNQRQEEKIGNLKVERKELGVMEGNKTGKVDGIIVG